MERPTASADDLPGIAAEHLYLDPIFFHMRDLYRISRIEVEEQIDQERFTPLRRVSLDPYAARDREGLLRIDRFQELRFGLFLHVDPDIFEVLVQIVVCHL